MVMDIFKATIANLRQLKGGHNKAESIHVIKVVPAELNQGQNISNG